MYCVFVFDRDILDWLPSKQDRRVEFIHDSVVALDHALRALGGGLLVRHAKAADEIPRLAEELGVASVFTNHDYEPQALARDAAVAAALAEQGRALHTFKDQVIFEKDEVLTGAGTFFSVFTPYKNAWMKKLTPFYVQPYPVHAYAESLAQPNADETLPSLEALGFSRTNLRDLKVPTGASGAQTLFDNFKTRIERYEEARNFPALKGPSYLSFHLRFGTISIRSLARFAHACTLEGANLGAQTWLNELIWRDFYMMILHHNPRVVIGEGAPFKRDYAGLQWDEGPQPERLFAAWCVGQTGYPLVDAAMRQLNQTGYMHNRLRMVVASFLTKDLGIDYRRGERYFADQLNDFDLSANNGGWQWAASTGCDAQPYFRIFNPITQSEKFDARGQFIRRYVPELAQLSDKNIHAPWLAEPMILQAAGVRLGEHYPQPIIDHAQARERTLARFAAVKNPLPK